MPQLLNHHALGSSPHAWGTLEQIALGGNVQRFIPTCVGNTTIRVGTGLDLSVHPHMRGEHRSSHIRDTLWLGSSPHAWGTLVLKEVDLIGNRFIPTCVGNTITVRPCTRRGTVHPHMRGEHTEKVCSLYSASGSSPHAWGTQDVPLVTVHINRFIPTCVGNTHPVDQFFISPSVHPHMRGEHCPFPFDPDMRRGSSPHAWGTQHRPGSGIRRGRFIPTCVGNTRAASGIISPFSVHPHMRGEHFQLGNPEPHGAGSSPHAWGTHDQVRQGDETARFIPTCVGNTQSAPF